MVQRPSTLPMWAEQDDLNPEINNYNVVEPPLEKRLKGWNFKEFAVRNWLNWLGRWTYRNLEYLIQQEAKQVMSNNDGIGLFPLPASGTGVCVLYAVDISSPDPINYLFAIGSNNNGILNFKVVSFNALSIPANPIVGPNVPVSGGLGPNTIITCGETKSQAI